MPSEDKEKIRIAEEKIREELKDKTIEINQEDLQTENQQKIKMKKLMKMKIELKRNLKNKIIEIKLSLHSV